MCQLTHYPPVDGEVEHGEGAEGDDAGDDEARQVDVVEGVVLVHAHRRRTELDHGLVEQRRVGVLLIIPISSSLSATATYCGLSGSGH